MSPMPGTHPLEQLDQARALALPYSYNFVFGSTRSPMEHHVAMTDRIEHIQRVTSTILERAYELDGHALDACVRLLGFPHFPALLNRLTFLPADTGGGFGTMCAILPNLDYEINVTNGEASLPESPETFFLSLGPSLGREDYFLFINNNQLVQRGGMFCEYIGVTPTP